MNAVGPSDPRNDMVSSVSKDKAMLSQKNRLEDRSSAERGPEEPLEIKESNNFHTNF